MTIYENPHCRVTAAQAAELFNLPVWKFWDAARKGTIPVERFANRRILFKVADIEAAFTKSKGGNNGK